MLHHFYPGYPAVSGRYTTFAVRSRLQKEKELQAHIRLQSLEWYRLRFFNTHRYTSCIGLVEQVGFEPTTWATRHCPAPTNCATAPCAPGVTAGL